VKTQKVTYFVIYSRAMPITKRVVRVLAGWGRLAVGDFHIFALYIYQKMFGNPAFPNPPVDLSLLKAAGVPQLVSISCEQEVSSPPQWDWRDAAKGKEKGKGTSNRFRTF
jgi:hypothetical protein